MAGRVAAGVLVIGLLAAGCSTPTGSTAAASASLDSGASSPTASEPAVSRCNSFSAPLNSLPSIATNDDGAIVAWLEQNGTIQVAFTLFSPRLDLGKSGHIASVTVPSGPIAAGPTRFQVTRQGNRDISVYFLVLLQGTSVDDLRASLALDDRRRGDSTLGIVSIQDAM